MTGYGESEFSWREFFGGIVVLIALLVAVTVAGFVIAAWFGVDPAEMYR